MLNNPLLSLHEQAEALFLPFGPDIQIVESYGQPEAEYAAIRKSAALMDAPHRAIVEITGKDRLSFLNNLITHDAKTLAIGHGCYAFLLNTKGRIVNDMYVFQASDRTVLDVDARLAQNLCRTLDNYVFGEDVKISDGSSTHARLSLIGPSATSYLERLGDNQVGTLANLNFCESMIEGIAVSIFRNDLCGQSQFEIIVSRTRLSDLWQSLLSTDTKHAIDRQFSRSIRPVGWSAFNIARIESGTLLFGIDITEHNLPMETAHWYLRAVNLKKGCYLGQEVVARMHSHNSVARMFVGMKVTGTAPPVAAEEIRDDSTPIGMITSSCISPMLGQMPIAMGYVKRNVAQNGKEFQVYTAQGPATAVVCPLPFWMPRN